MSVINSAEELVRLCRKDGLYWTGYVTRMLVTALAEAGEPGWRRLTYEGLTKTKSYDPSQVQVLFNGQPITGFAEGAFVEVEHEECISLETALPTDLQITAQGELTPAVQLQETLQENILSVMQGPGPNWNMWPPGGPAQDAGIAIIQGVVEQVLAEAVSGG